MQGLLLAGREPCQRLGPRLGRMRGPRLNRRQQAGRLGVEGRGTRAGEVEWVVSGGWWMEKRKVVVRRGQARWGGDGNGASAAQRPPRHRQAEGRRGQGGGQAQTGRASSAARQRGRVDAVARGACSKTRSSAPLEVAKNFLDSLKRDARTRPLARSWW